MNVRLKSRSDAQAIERFIERQIAAGAWKAGDKLPTERELVRQFRAARNTVRKTLKDLECSGRILRQVGRGTFVARPSGRSDGNADVSPGDFLEFRLLVEPALADMVIARASMAEFRHMEECLRRADDADDWRDFEHWDDQFHQTIARATRNELLIEMMARLSAVRRRSQWGQLKERSLTGERRRALQADHYRILSSLVEREPERARTAMRDHLLNVRQYMLGG